MWAKSNVGTFLESNVVPRIGRIHCNALCSHGEKLKFKIFRIESNAAHKKLLNRILILFL